MKKLLLLLLISFLYIHAFGQGQNVDSLINVLNTQKLSAEKKMSLYNDICLIFMQNDLDKFIMYTDKGLELADKEQDKRMLAIFYGFSGIYHFYKANYDTAHSLYEKALEYAIKIEDKFLEAKLYSNIALLYSMKGDYHTEIEYNLKALSIYEKIDEKKTFITLLVNIGTTYRSLSEHKKALYYFDRANKLAEETNYNHGRLLVYYAYANVYYDKKDFDKSLEYYLKSEKISKEENNKHFEILCLQSLSTFYSEVEKYQDLKKAEEYANESLAIALEFGDPFRIRGSKRVLAHLYKQQQRYKDCDLLASEAWAIDSIDIDTSYGLASMIVISNIHLNNKEKAEYFFNKYIELNGEKNKKNLQETLIGLEVKYETEKKELQIASLEKEKQLYTWLGIGGVLFAITLGIVLWQNIRNIKKEKQLIATQSVMNGEMNERSRLARDLHDRLSGNLSAVKIELNNAESLLNISDKLDSCIDEIRRVAHNLMPVSLQHGVKAALEDFAAQFPNVHFHFFGEDSRLEERMEFVIYCCANELINNSLKHSEALNINLQLVQDDKHLTLTVQDDGRGYDEKAVKKGLGLQNIYDRVTSCNGKIDVVSSPDKGTETTIELKIK